MMVSMISLATRLKVQVSIMTFQIKEPISEEFAIHVESEWAELKECVYGSPNNWVLPVIYKDVKLRAQGKFGEFWIKNGGRDMKEISIQNYLMSLVNRLKEQLNF